jgi:hypothetical protein
MKLRCQSNSIRLRLKRSEVERLMQTGRFEETIRFGPENGQSLVYRVELISSANEPRAAWRDHEIIVQIPAGKAAHWASSDKVEIEGSQPAGKGDSLQLLVEKDFACLNDSDAQNADTFPNPLAGSKC